MMFSHEKLYSQQKINYLKNYFYCLRLHNIVMHEPFVSSVSCVRKSKVLKVNRIKTYWLSEHTFSCLVTWHETPLRASYPISGKNSVKFTHTYFSLIHLYTRTSDGLRVGLSSCVLIKKFTDVSFLTYTLARLKVSDRTSLTKSCRYWSL